MLTVDRERGMLTVDRERGMLTWVLPVVLESRIVTVALYPDVSILRT